MGIPRFRVDRSLLLLLLFLPLLVESAGCRQRPWTLWNSYAAHFIDGQGRVIDPRAGDHSTSEGQAYALFFALTDNDRATFDRVLNWTTSNMAGGDLEKHLPGWLWGKNKDGAWTTLDTNSAADADVWMAYTLVEAGRLWQAPLYGSLGRSMMDHIAQTEVADLPGFGMMLLPGPSGFQHDRSPSLHSWTLNPSYLPLFIFERLAVVDPGGPWQKIALNIPRLLQQSAVHGYAMDWVEYLPGDGFYPTTAHPAQEGKPAEIPLGSYDAIRVYLWAGMLDENHRRRTEMLGAVPAMSAYLAQHDAPPEKISDVGIPLAQDGPVGFSAALLPYLRAFPHQEKPVVTQMIRLSLQKNTATGLYGKDQGYYDQNLALFASGFLEGRFHFGEGGVLNVEWTRA
jgi:endoglucanase